MALFKPKRLIIKPQSKHSPIAKAIIDRTRSLDPSVSVEYLKTKDFTYPVETPREKFEFMKESVIISERVVPFIRTFDSPGNIVESLTTVLNLTWMCASRCEFCYLQNVQTPEHYFYTNLRDAEHEIASSGAAHTAILTLWTHLSIYFNRRLLKLPDRFMETSDWLREQFVAARVRHEREAIDRYFGLQRKLIEQLNDKNKTYRVDDRFRKGRATIAGWYKANSRYPLRLTASEFNDFLAVDHLTGNGDFLMRMAEKYSHLTFTIRSRSSYVDNFLKHDGLGRATFHMVMSPDQCIKDFEHGTSSLDERIHAARSIQEAKGFPLNIVFEPVITYPGFMDDYNKLIERLRRDLDPDRIGKFILGSMRFNNQLRAMIQLHFPDTHLFDEQYQYVPPQDPDTKNRYLVDTRESIYTALSAGIRASLQKPFVLGSETPEIWDRMNLNRDDELANSVYEPITENTGKQSMPSQDDMPTISHPNPRPVPEDVTTELPATAITPPTSAVEEEDEDAADTESWTPMWTSLSPQNVQDVYEILSERDEGTDFEKLEAVALELKGMCRFEEHVNPSTNQPEGNSVNDSWVTIQARTISNLKQHSLEFQPVKIIGTIAAVSDFTPHEVSQHVTRGFVTLTIEDLRENTIRTLEIAGDTLHIDLHTLHEKNTRCTFLGAVVSVFNKRNKGSYRLFLHDILPKVEALDLLSDGSHQPRTRNAAPSSYDLKDGIPSYHPLRLRKTHPGQNGIIQYVVDTLAQNLGIRGLESAPELKRALEFVTLQAFSQGKSETLEKLHGLVIGPPNSGKSYLTKAALILNPIAQEIISTPNKITEAGLVGSVKPSAKKNRSIPGILPQNHGGVVCIQEFHDIRGKKRDAVCSIFVRMMEEGQVIDSTSANTTHLAETGVLLDMNRYSHIYPDRSFDSFSDIDIPVNLLARFDYIMEIPKDEARSQAVAEEMTKNFGVMGKAASPSALGWQRELQFIIAFLKAQYLIVEFPYDLQTMVSDRVESMLSDVHPKLQGLVEDMRLRIIRSVFKLAKATTAANSRRIATEEDVEYALRFVQDKVNLVKGIKVEDVRTAKPDISDRDKRREVIDNQFRGKHFTIEAVQSHLASEMEGTCEIRTIQRDLGALGAKPLKKPKGTWSLK